MPLCLLLLALSLTPQAGAAENVRNDAAIQEIQSGRRTTANAAWWGFKAEDSTAAIQGAIDSGAKRVLVPYVGAPWIVRPMKLRSKLELVFEPGVLLLAKKGEFRGGGDSMFTAVGATDLSIRGYGATLRMRKSDYQQPPYTRAEWRMGIGILGCRNVLIEGLRIESTGGDGIYVDGGPGLDYSENVTIRNVVSHDNHRQGLSVISAQNLLVEDSVFSGTRGTPPEAGIDFEPDTEKQRFVNCVVRNTVFENNAGHGILVYLKPLTAKSQPVSIRVENCHSRMILKPGEDVGGGAGMAVGAAHDNGPRGLVEFIHCTSENTGQESAKIFDKSADAVKVRFEKCSWTDPWTASSLGYGYLRVPVYIPLRNDAITNRQGGIEFDDCYVYDKGNRPPIAAYEEVGDHGLHDVHGLITVRNPAMRPPNFGRVASGVDVNVVQQQ